MLVGVGGQGIILASEIMADVFMEAGFDVKKSEVHGMSQRGGSVSTHVRFGPRVFSPLIKEGETDIFLAFEELEALRYLYYLSPEPMILFNEQRLNPPSVSLGNEVYPGECPGNPFPAEQQFKNIAGRELALKAGDGRAANVVLLGALQSFLSIPEKIWTDNILRRFPPKAGTVNLEAFRLGTERLKYLKRLTKKILKFPSNRVGASTKIFLLTVFFLCSSGLATGQEDGGRYIDEKTQMGLGDYFFQDGDYYRAVTEYKRFLFFFPRV